MKRQIISFFTAALILICTFSLNGFSVGDVIDFSRDSVTLYAGQEYQLKMKSGAAVEFFTSSDPEIVSVDDNGIVKAVSTGISTITAADPNGNQAFCTVTVKGGTSPEKVVLEKSFITLTEGGSQTLNAKVLPEDAPDLRLHYFSSDESVAKIDENGNIRAVHSGTTVITAESSSAAVYAMCSVRVLSKKGRTGFEASVSGSLFTIAGDKKSNMIVVIKNANDTVESKTDTEGKFSFDSISQGSYNISVYKSENDKEPAAAGQLYVGSSHMDVTCIINGKDIVCLFQNENTGTASVNEVYLAKGSIELNVGSSYDVVFRVHPEDAAVPKMIGRSTDEDVAVVDSDGRITAVSEGNTTVIFKSSDGRFEKYCLVKVNAPEKNTGSWMIITIELSVIVLIIVLFSISYRRFNKRKENSERISETVKDRGETE